VRFASVGGRCVKCGEPIRHWYESTGRTTPPFNCEMSDGRFYSHLGGELCERCDRITPLAEKNPEFAQALEKCRLELDKIREE